MIKDGKELEKLVRLVEMSISPDARVEHNVDMPILNSGRGETTQCDVVIWSGKSPRETITLIEVQDRKSKVMPNDFRGWKQKVRDVGAQHLICVSKREFSKSIKEQAAKSGGAIMLMTFKEAAPETLPMGFARILYQFNNFDLKAINFIQPSISKSEAISLGVLDASRNIIKVNVNEKCWSLNGRGMVSLFILCRDFYAIPEGETSGMSRI